MKNLVVVATVAILAASISCQTVPQTLDVCLGKVKAMYQGNCISDYAIVPVTAVELAWCIRGNPFEDIRLSAQDLICNCSQCHKVNGNGCMGGNVETVLMQIQMGSITGGSYNPISVNTKTYSPPGPSNYVDCLKYWQDPCDPSDASCTYESFDPLRIPSSAPNTYCPVNCNRATPEKKVSESKVTGVLMNGQNFSTSADLILAVQSKKLVISNMEIYEDMEFFFDKPTAIFRHQTGQSLGVSAVIITGYMAPQGTNPAYWTVLVPWDRKYTDGLKGQTINIIAGVNHGGIETRGWEVRVA